jgi:2-C-methyl-D-erythritol 4-phosphate cytidylyltransferase
MEDKNNIVIVLAGGTGQRFGIEKQFLPIFDKPLFIYTLNKFKKYKIILTINPKFKDIVNSLIEFNSSVWKSKKEQGISLREPIEGIEIPNELKDIVFVSVSTSKSL